MTFTTQEEARLKLILLEEETRAKLDAERATIQAEKKTAIGKAVATIDTNYKTSLETLQTAYNTAEANLKSNLVA